MGRIGVQTYSKRWRWAKPPNLFGQLWRPTRLVKISICICPDRPGPTAKRPKCKNAHPKYAKQWPETDCKTQECKKKKKEYCFARVFACFCILGFCNMFPRPVFGIFGVRVLCVFCILMVLQWARPVWGLYLLNLMRTTLCGQPLGSLARSGQAESPLIV